MSIAIVEGACTIVAVFVKTSVSVPRHTSDKCSSRALVFSDWSSCDCEKSFCRPAHCHIPCVLARNSPSCARDDGAPDHQRDDCCVTKQDGYFMSGILHMSGNVYPYVNICVYV